MFEQVPSRMFASEAIGFDSVALSTAVFGLRENFGAERVYGALRIDADTLRFRVSAPSDLSAAGRVRLDDLPGARRALESGTVVQAMGAPDPFAGDGETLLVPFSARGKALGLAVMVMPEGAAPVSRQMLSFVATLVGEGVVAHADRAELADLVAGMRDSRAALEALMDRASEPMKVIDLDGRVRAWNRAAESAYGWGQDDVLGRMLPHVPEDLRLRALYDIRQIASSGAIATRELVHQRADESPLRVDVTVFPMTDADGHPSSVLSVSRVVVQQEQPPALGADVPTAIARELKAPLTAIAGYAQLLTRSEILEDSERRSRTVNALESNVEQMNHLIDSLMLADQVESGSLKLESWPTDLPSLLTDVLARLEQEGRLRGVMVDLEHGLPAVELDRRMFGRALHALAGSAAAASASGVVEVALSSNGTGIVLVVTASGSGPEAERVGDLLAGNNPGSDAGDVVLALEFRLAHGIVRAHGGTCDLHALPDNDMVITVDLPIGG